VAIFTFSPKLYVINDYESFIEFWLTGPQLCYESTGRCDLHKVLNITLHEMKKLENLSFSLLLITSRLQ